MPITQNAGAANAGVAKSSPGRVFSLRVSNINAAARYLCLVDKTTTPVGTDPASFWVLIPAGTAAAPAVVEVDDSQLGGEGLVFSVGVAWAVSTTGATVTLATAADHTVTIRWQ